jgi:cardiolipin synthase
VRDLHFRLEGPVVAQLQEAFAADWAFVTGEALAGADWFPPLEAKGGVVARAIPDGPDEDFEKLRWTILAALSCARDSVKIVTPYFLPDPPAGFRAQSGGLARRAGGDSAAGAQQSSLC